jgi:hypothetical protein
MKKIFKKKGKKSLNLSEEIEMMVLERGDEGS